MIRIKGESKKVFFWSGAWLVWMAVIFTFSHLPGSPTYYEPSLGLLLERKGAHLVEYAVLFLLSLQVFSLWFPQETLRRIVAIAFAWSLAYGVLDELHQFFTPFRGATFRDVLIDCIGILLALTGVFLLSYKRKKTRR